MSYLLFAFGFRWQKMEKLVGNVPSPNVRFEETLLQLVIGKGMIK